METNLQNVIRRIKALSRNAGVSDEAKRSVQSIVNDLLDHEEDMVKAQIGLDASASRKFEELLAIKRTK